MTKLEGILYKFDKYLLLRGFAPIGELAEISRAAKSYLRHTDDKHKINIVKYLSEDNSYSPEITLARKVLDYEGLIKSIWNDNEIANDEVANDNVTGLSVFNKKLPTDNDQARYAYLKINEPTFGKKLIRVDGNHRLEPFSSNIDWWYQIVKHKYAMRDEADENKKKEWLKHQAIHEKEKVAKKIVSFAVILLDTNIGDNFEAQIFHNINFKALPLREEASLKIISKCKDYKKMELEYTLAMSLIKKVEKGSFDSIYWLNAKHDIDKSYFRTACLRIAQLLVFQKDIIEKLLKGAECEEKELDRSASEQEEIINKFESEIKTKEEEIVDIKKNPDFEYLEAYKLAQRECDDLRAKLYSSRNEYNMLNQKQKYIHHKIYSLQKYVESCDNKDIILSSLTTLNGFYKELGEGNYGNISYLCALVYYSLLDENQLNSFVQWSKQNAINKLVDPDDLLKDSSLNLITMFDQIQQAKRNEIFISMQFGDSQSELIYEKICRSIDNFNEKHKSIYLRLRPIRIDRTTGCSSSVPDDIKKAIQSSGLIIADLSSANINVYQEVGYAMGLAESHNMAPNIILLYKENTEHNKNNKDVDKFIGFNLRSLSQLRFSNYDQLVNGLVERLEKYYEVGC